MPPKKRVRGPRVPPVNEEVPTPRKNQEVRDAQLVADQEFTNHDMEVIENEGTTAVEIIANEKLFPNEGKDERKMRRGIIEAFRTVFQARGDVNQDISVSTQKLCSIYKQALIDTKRATIEKYFQEVDARLVMFIEEVTVKEHRARVFKMVALAAIELFREVRKDGVGTRDSRFLEFLTNFIEEWSSSVNVAARINAISMIAYLFDSGDPNNTSINTFCRMPLDAAERMYLVLKRALRDREYLVRVQAIRGVGVLKHQSIPSMWGAEARESSPRELLMRSFRDASWECRSVALECFEPRENDAPILCDIAMYDKSLKVRVEAMDRLTKVRPSRFIPEKVAVLELAFQDHEMAMRDAASKIFKAWIEKLSSRWCDTQKAKLNDDIIETDVNDHPLEVSENKSKGYVLAAAALVLLWLQDVPETTEQFMSLKKLITFLLDTVRHMYHCHQDPVNTFAEVLMSDVKLEALDLSVPIITKSTIGSVLEISEFNDTQDVRTNRAMVYFWRCLIQFFVERRRTEGDMLSALMRFVPPLRTMVDHLEVILHRLKKCENDPIDPDETVESTYILEMSIVENFIVAMKHAPSDQAGKDAYRTLLLQMLKNPCYQKKIFDLIIRNLADYHSDCPEDLLSVLFSSVNEVRDKSQSTGLLPRIEGTVLVGEAYIRTKYSADGKRKSTSEKTGAQLLELYDLMVINSFLKTGVLKQWEEEYDDRYRRLFQRNINSKDIDMKILAMECVGMIAHYDISRAERMLGEMVSKFHSCDEPARATLFTVLTDLSIVHGLETIDEIISQYSTEPGVLLLFSDVIVSSPAEAQSELLFKAVEGLSKIMLHVPVKPKEGMWKQAMTALMFRASYIITDRFAAKVRSVIVVFLDFFCSLSRNNQMLVVTSFEKFFDMWENTANLDYLASTQPDASKKLKRCAAAFVTLTRHSILKPEMQQNTKPAHIKLADDAFKILLTQEGSSCTDYYMMALSTIEYESFDRTALNKVYSDLRDFIGVHSEDVERQRYNELRRIKKKVGKVMGINEDEEERMSPPPAPRAESRSIRARKAPSVLTVDEEEEERDQAADEGQDSDGDELEAIEEEKEDEEMDTEEPPEPSTSSKPRRGRPPRSQPASAQKKKNTDVLDILSSPQRNPRKPSSRQNTGTRPSAPSTATRAAPPRSARRLRSDK